MAKYPVYSYRDLKVGFGQPQIEANEPAAVRGFSMAINNSQGLMGFAPSDYELFRIGEFDSDVGTITPVQPIVQVCTGSQVFNHD